MITKIVNQQLFKLYNTQYYKTLIKVNRSHIATFNSSRMFQSIKQNSKRQQHIYNYTFRNVYKYRSEDKFIDFDKDYYQILGISQTANLQEIKQAFYHLAKEYHPDRNKGNDTKFKEINEAYNVLSQQLLRKDYDSNRFRDSSSPNPQQDNTLNDEKAGKASLNYGAYSQLSRAEWAIYRSGYMKHNKTDYSNYEHFYTPETSFEVQVKKKMQWASAFRNMTVEQVKQELQFRQNLYKKYCEDKEKERKVQQEYIDNKFKQLGDNIEKRLGKRIRSIYDRLIKK